MRNAIIDSGPLVCLVHLSLAPTLSEFFDLIYVPSAVQREVGVKHRFRHRLRRLYERGRFDRCPTADHTLVELHRLGGMGAGEAEALAQAQERSVRFVIVDDLAARRVVENVGMTAVGTVRLLARLERQGYLEDTRALVRKLERDLHFRIVRRVIDEAIRMADLPIGAEEGWG